MPKETSHDRIRESLVNAMIAVSISSNQISKTRPMTKDASNMLCSLSNTFLKELLTRLSTLATNSGRDTVTVEDFQRILPQMLLDFAS